MQTSGEKILKPSFGSQAVWVFTGFALIWISSIVFEGSSALIFDDLMVLAGLAIAGWGAVNIFAAQKGITYLKLNGQGMTRKTLFGTRFWRWSQISDIRVHKVKSKNGNNYVIRFQDSETSGMMSALNTQLGRGNTVITDTYGVTAQKLAALMNEYRDRALGPEGASFKALMAKRNASGQTPLSPVPVYNSSKRVKTAKPTYKSPEPTSYAEPKPPSYAQTPTVQKVSWWGSFFG